MSALADSVRRYLAQLSGRPEPVELVLVAPCVWRRRRQPRVWRPLRPDERLDATIDGGVAA